MTKFLLSLFLCASLASGATLIPSPSQINGPGGAQISVADGNATIQPSSGGAVNVVTGDVYVPTRLDFSTAAGPITVSGAGHSSLAFDGTGLKISINGAAYTSVGESLNGLVITSTSGGTLNIGDASQLYLAAGKNANLNVGLTTSGGDIILNANAAGATLNIDTGGTLGTLAYQSLTFGSGVATFLATPSGANLASALTTALPATRGGTGLTSLGTGIATALGTNTGSAGAPVLFNGAGGTPSSLVLTNATALPNASVTGLGALATVTAGTGVATAAAIAVNTAGGPLTHGGAGAHTTLSTTDATDSTAVGNGANIFTGGFSVAKRINALRVGVTAQSTPAAPGFYFSNDTTTGFFSDSSFGNPCGVVAGTATFTWAGGLRVASGLQLGWSSGTVYSTGADTGLKRLSAGNIQVTDGGSGTGGFTCSTLAASGAVTFTANTASTTTGTGTLVVTGGVGVSGRISSATHFVTAAGQSTNVLGGSNGAGFGFNAGSNTMGILTDYEVMTIRPSSVGGIEINTKATIGGNIICSVAGAGLQLKSGTGARAGNAVLVGGSVTVTNTTVTANTVVYLTRKTSGGTIGTALTYTLSAGASFTITSDSAIDTSTISFLLVELN